MMRFSLKALPLALTEEQKQALDSERKASQQEYDKLLVYLASGGLILTVGFVKDVVPLEKAAYLYLLKFTWASFSVSLFAALLSHMFSVWAIEAAQTNSVWWKLYNCVVKTTNIISLLLLAVGVMCFLFFTSYNLSTDMNKPERDVQKAQVQKPDPLQKGMTLSPLITTPKQPQKPSTPPKESGK